QMTREALALVDDFIPTKNHYLISRTWVGDYRLALRDDLDRVVGYASGRNSRETIEEARAIIAEVNKGIDEGMVYGKKVDPKKTSKLKEFHEAGA
ncbi:MAG: hypothetical protein GTO63_33280, partial [Anaerolineae bacterium]|nr:hypothetical protein [Anaerolineae bacterium]NIN99525.1 hypothetical protein [Anaerolineae bacterium]NIQ82388.1 hypothetical protein [Anaerolineae bacterium]